MSPVPTPTAAIVVAIDGPAASGKSSVARQLARRLGFAYVNSGALYRSATWFVLEGGLEARAAALAAAHAFTPAPGVEPDPSLFEARINSHVSAVSSVPEVRAVLTEKLRSFADLPPGVVMEGRDIGSAVFPQTPYKFYIDASLEVRAQRRAGQSGAGSDDLQARDRKDSTRRTSPLIIAEDAHVIDSSRLTIDGVVGEIIGRLKLKGLAVES